MSAAELRAALADDLDGLARLHDRELDAGLLSALGELEFPGNLALLPEASICDAMCAARDNLQKNWADAAWRDALAADYAAIYLNGAIGASPYESVWVTDEHLTCQLPMFELRACYQRAGLVVDDWRKRYDDHFVLQLQYLAHQLRDDAVPLDALGRFVDEHVGHWFPDFARTVAQRADTDFYRALAVLTAGWLARCRDLIEEISGEPRIAPQIIAERTRKKLALAAGELAPIKFMPGGAPAAGPSW